MPTCVSCGRENPDESRFCNSCGAAIEAPRAASAEERKVVTVLFADITGSTALGERLDAEQLKEVMGAFFAAMRAEIEAEGGTVEKFIGDAVMAAFGVPQVHEDDPARALRAALRMNRRLAELNEELAERHGVALELRIGINTGPVMAVTAPRPGEALATGDAVNAAARLEQAAAPGQVLVSERTAQAARHFRFASPQLLEIRGRAEPLRALELLAEQPITEGTVSGSRTPLVGRRRELELLTTTYERVVAEGRPHLATLYGEAGVGKSRLVAELLAGLEADAPVLRVVRGRCLAYGDGISYWPFAELLKAYAHALDTDSAEVARTRIAGAAEAALAQAGADAPAELADMLTASIGLAALDRPQRAAQEVRAETHLAWRSFFSALAAAAPTAVIVEDIQWADAAVLELLEDIAGHAAGPLFVICTARPELTTRRPTWGGGRMSFTGIAVEPLDAGESSELVRLLLAADADEGERGAIVARAEGNPFFLEEIARTRAASAAAANGLPDTVHAALAARIDLLPGDEKHTLQTAAVVGRVFWPGAVAEVAGLDAGAVSDLLDRLQGRDLILSRLASSMSGQRELIFKHALICEVAYESLPRRDRARMHRAVAAWIDRTFAGRRDEVVELIAFHLAAALRLGASEELRAAAFSALADAAEGAYARAGFERSLSLAREALAVAGPFERARALEAIGRASIVVFDGLTAWESLREAADIVRAEAPDDRERLAAICGLAVMIPTRGPGLMRAQPPAEEVLPYLELGLECAGERDSEALVLLLASQGYWAFGYGIDPADESGEIGRAAAERAREVARRLGRRDLELMALDSVSAGLNIRGLYGHAMPIDRERLDLARTLRDSFEVGDSFYTAAWSSLAVGLYPEVVALVAEFEAMGIDLLPIGPLSLAVLAQVPLGDWDAALADQARVVGLLDDRADRPPSMASGGYGAAAFIHEARGEPAATDGLLAVIDSWSVGGEHPRNWAVPLAAAALVRRREFAAARRTLGRLAGSNDLYLDRELETRCALVAEEGSWHDADAIITRARAHAATGELRALPLHADRLEGRARLAAGDAEGALEPLARAVAGFGELSAAWEVAQTRLAYAEALAVLGRTDDAEGALKCAAELFERLRVPRELAQARAQLAALRPA